MSLARVIVPHSDFDLTYDHVASHYPRYRNMHLREACQRDDERDLRYLHAMRAVPGATKKIEGMISGPGVYWHYTLTRTQLTMLAESADERARKRIQKRFLPEILRRVALEKTGSEYYPKRTEGQFYLRRWNPGSAATHRHCVSAVANEVLDRRFVSVLASWNFELLCP